MCDRSPPVKRVVPRDGRLRGRERFAENAREAMNL
jgi:hypothetical protein